MALVAIVAMYAMWVFTMAIGPFIHLRFLSEGWHLILCIALCGASFAFSSVAKGPWQLIAYGLAFGSALGTIFSFSLWYHDVMVDARGFWVCVLLWFINVIAVAGSAALLVGSCIQMFKNLLTLNFLPVLLCFMLGVTAFFTGMSVIAGAFECHAFLGIMTLVALTGGAGGAEMKNMDPGVVTDSSGNMHFVVDRSGDTINTTDGKRMRRMNDGNYQEF